MILEICNMSTNYYLRHRPPLKKINELKMLIEFSKQGVYFDKILKLAHEIYDTPGKYESKENWGVLHIGKRSAGWKFQWCPNLIEVFNSYIDKDGKYVSSREYKFRYPLTKQGLTDFIMQEDILVMDECKECQDKAEFLKMAFNWEKNGGLDSLTYRAKGEDMIKYSFESEQQKFKDLGFNFLSPYQSDFCSDGLRWTVFDDFS